MTSLSTTTEPTVEFERHRRELTGYCYRMLGSPSEAEDAVQETMLRAWRSYDRFEGRAAIKSWLYKIATNVCHDMLAGRKRRALPMDFGPASTPTPDNLRTLPEATWIEPIPEGEAVPEDGDPAAVAEARETLRLAFVVALQRLPASQRAVLILREVLRWKAAEVAELLGTSVASVNSSLQRARAALAQQGADPQDAAPAEEREDREVVERYAAAFEAYDIDAIVSMLSEDARMSMPPYDLWLQGPEDLRTWYLGPGIECEGSRLVPVAANGAPAFAQYRRSQTGPGWEPWAIQVLDIAGGRIRAIETFLDTERLFPRFGLPPRLED